MQIVCAVMPWHAEFARSENGVPIAYEVVGECKPLVLLHGVGEAHACKYEFDDVVANPRRET
jgi:hypothetical protein